MEELSELSSSDDDESKAKDTSAMRGKKKRRGHPAQEGAVSTLVVLVLGCWMMRVPLMLRDLTRCVLGFG